MDRDKVEKYLKNYTQEQLEKYVRFFKPFINIQLRTANSIVKRKLAKKLFQSEVK